MKLTALASLAALAAVGARKTLRYGPMQLPHSHFVRAPVTPSTAVSADKEPKAVARTFVSHFFPSIDWKIRADDESGGVFFRQYINGLEVANGGLNFVIEKGQIILYADSLFRGSVPVTPLAVAHDHTHADICSQLSLCSAQAPLSAHSPGIRRTLGDLYGDLRVRDDIPRASIIHSARGDCYNPDPREATLHFIYYVTPNQTLADEITHNFKGHMDRISLAHVLVIQDGVHWTELLDGVPGTNAPVKARLAYFQTPSKDDTSCELILVWMLDVSMSDNIYDAAVSAFDSSALINCWDSFPDDAYYYFD